MPQNSTPAQEAGKPRVAVVAIHGVADQKPHETAQTIAGMLLGLRGSDAKEQVYSDFREFELRIPVERVLQPPAPLAKPNYFTFDPRNELFKDLHTPGKGSRDIGRRITQALEHRESVVAEEEEPVRGTLEHQIMREQLEYYDPLEADLIYKTNDRVYETAQLTGFRTDGSTSKEGEVHLYEMYWADLSRVSSDIWRVVIDFYQLLAYLSGIGRKTLYFAQAESRPSRLWNWFRNSQLIAECMLTLAIPIINLCLLAMATIVLPFQVPGPKHHLMGVAASSLTIATICASLVYLKRKIASANRWPWLLLFPAALGLGVAVAGTWGYSNNEYAFYASLAFGFWIVLAALLLWAMKSYNARRTGALMTGIIAAVLTSVIYLLELWFYCKTQPWPTIGSRILAAASETALWLCVLLAACWVLFLLSAMLTSIFGLLVRKSSSGKEDHQPGRDKGALRRAIWTVNLTLISPAALTLIFNLGIWEALSLVLRRFKDHPVAFSRPSLFPFPGSFSADSTQRVMDWMISAFASYWFTIFSIAVCIAALIAVWALLPAVVSDNSPGQTEADSKWLGEALSKGYRTMRVSGEILRVILFVGFFVVLLLIYSHTPGRDDLSKVSRTLLPIQPIQEWTSIEHVLPALGLVLLLMLTASQGVFRFLALGFRSTVDIALDVANWLRSNPLNANPKARITARCVSQLKYLAEWRDPRDGGGYKAFVIIAHSQGTVIISEILRFLQVEQHPVIADLSQRAIYLFTMGSPLRQLYSLRFPHQYAWARHNAATWAGTHPDPKRLGIAEWVNAYRSGDYVGRYLWHPDQGDDPWGFTPYAEHGNYTRREFCIGPGDHTHYWDETAPQIAKQLDELIAHCL